MLSNEEVVDGVSERGGHPVYRRPMKQWVLKITEYADRLLEDLDELDWPESIKDMQRNWIGRSEGARVSFNVENTNDTIDVFTTRPDTIYGTTFLVLSPEHALVNEMTTDDKKKWLNSIKKKHQKSDLERTDLAKDKSGVFTGAYAINPLSGKNFQFGLLIMYYRLMVRVQLWQYQDMMSATMNLLRNLIYLSLKSSRAEMFKKKHILEKEHISILAN